MHFLLNTRTKTRFEMSGRTVKRINASVHNVRIGSCVEHSGSSRNCYFWRRSNGRRRRCCECRREFSDEARRRVVFRWCCAVQVRLLMSMMPQCSVFLAEVIIFTMLWAMRVAGVWV